MLNTQLRSQRRRRHAVVVGLLEPLERRLVPPRRKRRADRILSLHNLIGHVVGLVHNPLAIVGPSRRQHLVARIPPSIEAHDVSAERRHIESRRPHRFFYGERMPQLFHGIRNPRVPHRFRALSGERLPNHGRLPRGIVKALLVPPVVSPNRRFPIFVAREARPRSIRIFNDKGCDHWRRVVGRHSIGIRHVVQHFNRNGVLACAQMRSHIGANEFLPRHLPKWRQRILSERSRAIHPRGNRVPPGGIERRKLYRLR